jgi:hypothetical protein
MPIGRCSRTACWAAAIEVARAIVIGKMTSGNSTVLRTGTMISASLGIGAELAGLETSDAAMAKSSSSIFRAAGRRSHARQSG